MPVVLKAFLMGKVHNARHFTKVVHNTHTKKMGMMPASLNQGLAKNLALPKHAHGLQKVLA